MATENDKVNTGALGTLVAVGVFATLSVALSVTALVRYSVQGVVDQRQTLVQQAYRDLRQQQTEKLNANPVWTDKLRGLVSIPIGRAEMKVLGDLAKDPTSATPAPPPSAAPADSAAAAEAAPPAPTAALEKSPAPGHKVASVKSRVPGAPTAPSPKPTDG
jgi:heme exporter protein D